MASAADFRRAIQTSAAFATSLAPDDVPLRATIFIGYLCGTLRAMNEPDLDRILTAMLPTNPAAAAAPALAPE